ncbi:phage antirepressor [Mitsuokella jalaludinii]|uniref:phage antirepressor n=1 Tax=Mitsuokella jalaludinii TaxID=187979 RepID=UPI00242AC02D|nr:phage antirepressor KilAC domain-containing protein [Mitsuokella jalaludinii]
MNDVKIFENPEFGRVRTTVIDGEPWFVAADVCHALDIGNPSDALNRLDDDERTLVSIEGASNGKPVNGVNEPGLYSLVLGSRKPEAKAFKRWITHEVIPAIRKTGGYHVPQSPAEQMAQGLLAAQKLLAEKDKRIEEMRPKEIFADAVSVSKTDILIGDLAKLIKQNGHDIGQKRLFAWLREKGYLIKRKGLDWNMPTQKAMEMKLFRVKETVVTHADGHTTVSKTPKVTGKGQIYFVNKFLRKALN